MFSEKLKELRKNKGITQEELAEQIFISRSAIAKWEQGKGLPNKESLNSLASFFNITIDELFDDNDSLIVIENIEKNARKNIRNLIICFSIIILIITSIVVITTTSNNYKLEENEFFSKKQLTEYGFSNIEKINGEDFFLSITTIYPNSIYKFHSNIDNKMTYDEYAKYIFDSLRMSPYVSYLSFAVNKPETDYTISSEQYLIQSDDLKDYSLYKVLEGYEFYYFINLSKNRLIQEEVVCHRVSLHYNESSTGGVTFKGEIKHYNFSMTMQKVGSQKNGNSFFKYYLADEWYNIKRENINNDNFQKYFNDIKIQSESSYYYIKLQSLQPIIYFAKADVEIELTITLVIIKNGVLETKTITRDAFLGAYYNWSTYIGFTSGNFGYDNFDGIVSLEVSSINIGADSYIYICEKYE